MRHDLLTLDLLQEVCRTHSITRAAQHVHLALAAASKRLSDFESRLGVKLFVRKSRGVEPTDACLALLKHVQVAHGALEAFDQEVARFAGGIKGFIRIAVAREVALDGLLRKVTAFSHKHPGVHVSLLDCAGAEVEERVASADADLGFFLRPAHGSTLQAWLYAQGRWKVLVPRGHLLADRSHLSFADLMAFELVSAGRSSPLAGVLSRAAAMLGETLQSRLEAGTAEMTAGLVEAGAGLALATDHVADRCAATHRVTSMDLNEDWAAYDLMMGIARRERVPLALERLVLHLLHAREPAAPQALAA